MSRSALSLLLVGSLLTSQAFAQSNFDRPSSKEDKADKYTVIPTTPPQSKADSDISDVLAAQAALKPKPVEHLTPAEARLQPTFADGLKAVEAKKGITPKSDVKTKDITIDTGNGSIPARVYTPTGADPKMPLPVVVYYHGGGFVIATIDTYDASPRAIASMANAIVVSVEYRKAPENPFPAAHDDAFAAYQWVLKNAAGFGGDAKRVAVMGESAGGNLAINVAIAARDHQATLPVAQVLVYPVAGTNMMTPSYIENEQAKPLNKAMMQWFVKYELPKAKEKSDPRIDLVGHADLHNLPPTTVITDQIDPLRSEGMALATKLKESGVTVDSRNYTGMTHEFFGMGSVVAKAKDAESFAATNLKTAFAQAPQ